MNPAINIALLVVAGLCFLGAVAFVWRAVASRSSMPKQAYDVGQVEAKRMTQANLVLAGFMALLGLLFLGVYSLIPVAKEAGEATPAEPVVPLLPSPAVDTEQQAPAPAPSSAPPVVATSVPTAAPSATAAAPTETPVPSTTPTPAPETAVVTSGVGVWLRDGPSVVAEQLEWLLTGSIVVLLGNQETGDDLLWENVRAESGVEGWVAAEFLAIEASASP